MDLGFRIASHRDVEAVLALQRPYYENDGYPFEADRAQAAIERLIDDPDLGRIWVAVAEKRVVGYVVVTLGFSLEYGGRDAFVDELVFAETHRGHGFGGRALHVAEAYAREQGVRALHLEVERHLDGARRLYERAGFVDQDRFLLTKRLGRSGGEPGT